MKTALVIMALVAGLTACSKVSYRSVSLGEGRQGLIDTRTGTVYERRIASEGHVVWHIVAEPLGPAHP
jgi:hypothetical protein